MPPSAMRCSVTISSGLRPREAGLAAAVDDTNGRVPVCSLHEWAEHALRPDDDPCDDGRAGEVCDEETAECGR
jgi:hypothetical protein